MIRMWNDMVDEYNVCMVFDGDGGGVGDFILR